MVNGEFEELDAMLRDAPERLQVGGRLAIISFHSLEDRIVKHTFRALAAKPSPVLSILTKKPLRPSAHEKQVNPRSRSAKLRVAERLEEVRA